MTTLTAAPTRGSTFFDQFTGSSTSDITSHGIGTNTSGATQAIGGDDGTEQLRN